MVSMVTSHLYYMASANEEFKKSSYCYESKSMFENHDVIFWRNANGYLHWIQDIYGDKWVEHIGNIKYGEVDGKMELYVPNKDGNILAR